VKNSNERGDAPLQSDERRAAVSKAKAVKIIFRKGISGKRDTESNSFGEGAFWGALGGRTAYIYHF